MDVRNSTSKAKNEAATGAAPCPVGTFQYDVANDALDWSDSLFQIYGYEPGEIRPTTALLVEASHPDDRAQVVRVLATTLETGVGCVHAHRIVTPAGETRHIVIVGSGVRNESGEVDRFTGYAVDVTRTTENVVSAGVNDALQSVVAARAVIEQAKGVLMLAFGVDADTAFGVLSWQSQTYNLKLRALAERVVADVACVDRSNENLRAQMSHVVLTAHERVGS
ncbi:PAS and ANTAR domain-containing protein [Rhodococcoides yunnanense]|uniref:PAS and ANTAR domain-containing protein n=1 Tax=Rhodococcoides yunnanense TaxID=278209 RepID=UPI0009FC2813|nr:PAS and ANTAR domain-containing protein [Rhodococcus yunnanensis]